MTAPGYPLWGSAPDVEAYARQVDQLAASLEDHMARERAATQALIDAFGALHVALDEVAAILAGQSGHAATDTPDTNGGDRP